MKNSIYFDETFAPVLLVNEESDPNGTRNTVWLDFQTGDGSNPYLEIYAGDVQYTVALDPETKYIYQLAGLYWAAGGVTSIRLVAGGSASEYVYITFPDIINTDAALLEENEENHSYFMQGKTDDAAELKSETIKYTNGRDYNIGQQMQKVIEFIFSSANANATGLLTATILITASNITNKGVITVRIRVNRTFDEVFIPMQTVENGKHIITICYPVSGISQNNRNQVDIYLQIDDGAIEILQQQAIATLTASGIATSGGFSGEIEVGDYAEAITINDRISVASPSESLRIVSGNNAYAEITEAAQLINVIEVSAANTISDFVRIVNYEGAKPLMTENLVDYLTTEDGDNLYTEQEHT